MSLNKAMFLMAAVFGVGIAQAAPVSYTTLKETKSENFLFGTGSARDVPWQDGTTFTGWTAYTSGGTGSPSIGAGVPTNLRVTTGGESPNAIYLYRAGTASTNHRFFTRGYNANSAAGTGYISYGWSLANNTGTTIEGFSFGYTGFVGTITSGSAAETLKVQYAIGATNVSNAGATWTDISSLLYAPTVSDTSQVFAPVTTTGLSWANGQTLTVRFVDGNNTGTDANLMIDNVAFSAPEPGAVAAVGLAAIVAMCRRVRRR